MVIWPFPAVAVIFVGKLPNDIDVVSAGTFGSGEALTYGERIETFPSASSTSKR